MIDDTGEIYDFESYEEYEAWKQDSIEEYRIMIYENDIYFDFDYCFYEKQLKEIEQYIGGVGIL